MKLDRETAQALVRLSHSKDFQTVMTWLDRLNSGFVAAAVHGIDDKHSPDCLRGRAQAMAIIKSELENAPEVAGRIQQVR